MTRQLEGLDHVRGFVTDLGPATDYRGRLIRGRRAYVWGFKNALSGATTYGDDTYTTLSDAMDSCAQSVSELRVYLIGQDFARRKGSMLDDILAVVRTPKETP